MQFVDFKRYIENSEKEIKRLLENRFITDEQYEVLDKSKIEKCLNSQIMQRLLKSEKIYREYRFTVNINASLVEELELQNCDEEIILQGAIDTAFVESDKIVILDYKTDKVQDIGRLKVMYKKQLDLYKIAIEQCTGKKVLECVIYSFEFDDYIVV